MSAARLTWVAMRRLPWQYVTDIFKRDDIFETKRRRGCFGSKGMCSGLSYCFTMCFNVLVFYFSL